MCRLLVTGGSGLLGSSLVSHAAGTYDVVATHHTTPVTIDDIETMPLDLTSAAATERIRSLQPDSIVHCAAMTDVDYCERHPEEARAVNVEATETITGVAADIGARLVHISTDAVFDGEQGTYRETSDPAPANAYGQTKLAAERTVLDSEADAVVVRTCLYGWNVSDDESLAEWMLRLLREGREVPAFEDSYFTPLYTRHLSECLLDVLTTEYTGLLHVASRERCSKLQFAETIADVFDLPAENVVPTSIDSVDFDATRGRDLSLCTERAAKLLSHPLPNIREGLQAMKQDEP